MADNTGTTVSNDTLNSLLRSGQNTSFDQSMFNAKKVEAIANPYANLNTSQLNALQLPAVPAGKALNPTQQAARDLTQATYNLNAQAFNNQQQAIQSNQEKQVRSLSQSAKDTQSQLLGQFGINNLASPTESSRNYSLLTDVGTRLRGAVSDITNQSLNLLNQNTLNFGQTNVQALGQAQQMAFAERQQQFSEDITRGQETGQQYLEGTQTNTRTLAGQGFDFNKQVTEAGLTGQFNGQRTLQGRLTDSNLISSRLNQALGYASFIGEGIDPTGITTGEGFDPTKTSGTPNLQRQDFLKFQAPLLQQQVDIARELGTEFAVASAKAQLDSLKLQTAQTAAQLQAFENGGLSADVSYALANQERLLDEYYKNPTEETRRPLVQAMETIKNRLGSDIELYYNKVITDPLDPTGNLQIKRGAEGESPLLQHGYNGNSSLTSDNPRYNEDLKKIRNELSEDFVNIIKTGQADRFINKMFFSSPDQKKIALATGAFTEEDGKKTYGKYNFMELDTSGMNVRDVDDLNNAIQEGKTSDGTPTDNKTIDNLNRIISEFEQNKGLKVSRGKTLDSFLGTLQAYGVDKKSPLGIPNDKAVTMLVLGSQAAGPQLIEKDANFTELKNQITDLDSFVTNINGMVEFGRKTLGVDPTNINTDQLIRDVFKMGSVNKLEPIPVRDRANNIIPGLMFEINPSSVDLNSVKSLNAWYRQAAGSDTSYADSTLRAVLGSIGNSTKLSKPQENGRVFGASIEDVFKIR